ncbi:MAG: hypothetical protein ACREN7_06785 [Candidatus Dormibacteria bacterium]
MSTCSTSTTPPSLASKRRQRITGIFVDTSRRGQGTARAALEDALTEVAASGRARPS